MTEKKMQYIITGNSITLFVDGKSYSTTKDNAEWDKIKHLLTEVKEEDVDKDELIDLMSPKNKILRYLDSKKIPIVIEGGLLKYKDYVVKTSLVERIQETVERAGDVQPFLNFIENLFTNPSMQSVNELYLFLRQNNLPITDDGHFLAYKKVAVVEEGKRFVDIYTGKVDNSPGAEVYMYREEVDDERERTCSHGLHVCSKEYLSVYGSNNPQEATVVVVKVNPRDVVSVPNDYDNAKMRVCRYTVVKELPEYREKKLPDFYAEENFEEEDEMVDMSEPEERLCEICGQPLEDWEINVCDDCEADNMSWTNNNTEDLKEELSSYYKYTYTHAGYTYDGFVIGVVNPGEKPKDVLKREKEDDIQVDMVFENFDIDTKIKNQTKDYDRYLMITLYKDAKMLDKAKLMVPKI
jgi:hypothetical protein